MMFSRGALAALAAVFAMLGSFALPTNPASAAEKVSDYESIRESTVRIVVSYRQNGRTRTRYGTGWIVEAADSQNNAGLGTVVTAAHVVRRATRIVITQDGSEEGINAELKALDRDRDVAFLEAKDLRGQPLTLSQNSPKLGVPLKTLGFTAASDLAEEDNAAKSASLKSGSFSKAFRGDKSLDLLEHDIVVNPGYSGAPLLDECGRVIGILTRSGGHIDLGRAGSINTAQGVGFAIAANEVVKLAGDENVTIARDDSECGVAPPKPTPTPTSTSAGNGNSSSGGTSNADGGMSGDTLIAAAVIALGVLVAAIAAFLLFRKQPSSVSRIEPESDPVVSPIGTAGSQTTVAGADTSKTQVDSASSIKLTGTDPQGQNVSLTFGAGDLQSGGVLLGADRTAVAGLIDDQRPKRLVSRVHARLSFDGTSYKIVDEKATNGTFIGNRKLAPNTEQSLKDGDTLTLADVVLTVSIS